MHTQTFCMDISSWNVYERLIERRIQNLMKLCQKTEFLFCSFALSFGFLWKKLRPHPAATLTTC